jgi:hypothetical protein
MLIIAVIAGLTAVLAKLTVALQSGDIVKQETAMMEAEEELKALWDRVKFAKERG